MLCINAFSAFCFWQIRSLRVPYPLIQTVVLQNVRHLIPSSNAVIVALENSVFGFFPVPLGAQVCSTLDKVNAKWMQEPNA